VPMIARHKVIGVLTFASGPSGRRFGEEDLRMVEELGRRCGTAIDNSRVYGERDYIARALQTSLLPAELPRIPGVETAARFRPAGQGNEVGGDFYDLFETGGRGWTVVIGDVCGKGPEAASLTALARYTVRAASLHERSPGAVLGLLNAAMLEQRTDDRFATVLCAFVRPSNGGAELVVASGGHPLPIVVRADGRVETLAGRGMLLGVVPDPEVPDHEARLHRGDLLLLYTDGAIEVRRDGPSVVFGGDELRAVLRDCAGTGAGPTLDAIRDALHGAAAGPLRDDVALLALHVRD
jgi:serine phosphatase RsbU (regulator of sigma subunit)